MIPVGQLLKVDGALAADFVALRQAVGISRRAPLSARHALHAAVLIDQISDVAYVRRAELSFPTLATAGDILSFRAALRACDPALGPLMDLTSCGADCPRLQVVAEEVELDCFTSLPVEDLMVSLYNAGTVPRLMLVQKDMRMLPMQVLLQDATNWWSSTLSVSKMNE